ncbi:hypothetical protein FHW92_003808 [Novosphingobium sp. SG707]|nr:hypothetical protein [Novosphingobium sp. SG707]
MDHLVLPHVSQTMFLCRSGGRNGAAKGPAASIPAFAMFPLRDMPVTARHAGAGRQEDRSCVR